VRMSLWSIYFWKKRGRPGLAIIDCFMSLAFRGGDSYSWFGC
jgi:hypothetical protein